MSTVNKTIPTVLISNAAIISDSPQPGVKQLGEDKITRNRAGFQLFLNGNLQFSSTDEYRYH